MMRRLLHANQSEDRVDVDYVTLFEDPAEAASICWNASNAGNLLDGVSCHFERSWLGRSDLRHFRHAVEAVSKPWDEGIAKMEQMIGSIESADLPLPRSIKRTPVWDQEEGDFDFGRFADGNDYRRGVLRRKVIGHQFVTIAVQTGANMNTTPESMFWRGACAVALTHMLESQGYTVEVVAYEYGRETYVSERGHLGVTPAKRAGAPLNLVDLTNVLSPWYFRTIGFATLGLIQKQKLSPGLGYATPCPMYLTRHLTRNPDHWRIEGVWTKEAAVEACKTLVETLNHDEAATAVV